MAANALESSSDDISFNEWHFVPKSWTSEQYSDDDSIEIIEREVLRISTPSSSDNEDDEAESGNEVEEDESKVPGDLALVVAIPSNQDLEVPSNETFTENVQTIDTVDQCRCMIMENDPTNEALNITRTMFYSFIVALLAVIVVHINRDYLIDSLFRNVYREQENLDLDEETCPINARSKYEYMELQKEVNTLKKTFVDIVNESDDIAEILYPTIVGSVNEIKYLGNEVYYVDLKYRPIKYEPLHPDYVDPMNRIRFRLLRALKDIAVDCPTDEEVNVVGFQLPLLCKRPEKLCLFISRPQYKDIFNNIITSLEKDVDKMCDLFPDYCRRNLKEPKDDSREPLWKTGNPRFDDEHDPQFKGLQTLNRVSNTLNFVDAVQPEENAPTESKNEEDYEDENNLEKGASSDEEYEVVDRLDMSRGMSVLNMVETKINQLKKEINKSMKRFNKKYKKMFGKQFWKDFMCKEDCPEKAQDSEKIEDDSLSDKNNNKSDAHAEWITKRAEAREKRRKEHDEKLGKKCSEKNFDGWNSDMPHCKKEFEQEFKDGFKFYPNKFDYRAWIKRTRDKVKSEYKIFASKLKSKFKTLSNWKHYAKSMFQRFHF